MARDESIGLPKVVLGRGEKKLHIWFSSLFEKGLEQGAGVMGGIGISFAY